MSIRQEVSVCPFEEGVARVGPSPKGNYPAIREIKEFMLCFSTKPTCANRTIQLASVHMGHDATLFMMPMTPQRIRPKNVNQLSRRSHESH